jgi:hypothetical protein
MKSGRPSRLVPQRYWMKSHHTDRASSNEAHSGDQAFNDAGGRFRVTAREPFRSLNEAARGDREKRKGPEPGAAFLALPIPSDRKRKHIRDRKSGYVRQEAERIA